ncbi:MAG TPA: hypothetical protein DCM64_00810 [Gammaproteobacteria bacterium]|jgi:hypothetical protein|nr:hypothetical protein [Gammaproteobacteria bacterium]MDP6733061.1 hypothetical protein [Gammaproteobacteria bacterium]HAJ74975.1 hypothetical protein [Gammaproteobacteria bacterium]|tara:strand:+ start:482 stop:1462 length:981 start_codon:yes stop_codon:yes gene_type:complete
MFNRVLTTLGIALAGLVLAGAVSAQSTDMPRTAKGVPDLQGTYTYRTLTPLNRPRELEHLEVLTAEQAKEWQEFENRRQNRDLIIDSVGGAGYPPGVISYNNFWYERGVETIADRRTSLIYDPPNGRMPSLNAAGRERARIRGEKRRLSEGPEARSLADRCLMSGGAGPPLVPGAYNNNVQIVQTEDHLMILSEMIHRARIIRFDDQHQTRHVKWDGDAIAHWDGDTLVINTQHFYYHDNGRGSSQKMSLEERIRRVDANTLEYDFTIEDPLSWDESWSAKFPMRRIEDPIYEYACHEGNHGLPGILAGWRRYESMGMNGDGTPKE